MKTKTVLILAVLAAGVPAFLLGQTKSGDANTPCISVEISESAPPVAENNEIVVVALPFSSFELNDLRNLRPRK